MDIGTVKEIGEREIKIPDFNPERKEPERKPERVEPKREREDA